MGWANRISCGYEAIDCFASSSNCATGSDVERCENNRVVDREARIRRSVSDGLFCFYFFFQAEDGIRDSPVTGVQTCALPIYVRKISKGLGLCNMYPGVLEGDDVIAFLCKELDGHNVIVSVDQDLLQLIDHRTDVYEPIKKHVVTQQKDRKSVV